MSLNRRLAETVDTFICTVLLYGAVLIFVAISCFSLAIIYLLFSIVSSH